MSAYNETCAAIGNDYWNQRLFLLHADARYVDVMERTLYNGLLSGVSLDGKSFFYPNPLESAGQHKRAAWFGVACCPGNVTRFLASLPGYVYAQQGDRSTSTSSSPRSADVKMDNGRTVALAQDTRYPWDGARAAHRLAGQAPGRFTLYVRVPGWARGEPVPSDLYRFADTVEGAGHAQRRRAAAPLELEKGYARIDRDWKAGDVVELVLPMPVRRVAAQRVRRGRRRDASRSSAARSSTPRNGPTTAATCATSCSPDASPLATEFKPDLLNGVQVVKTKAVALSNDAQGPGAEDGAGAHRSSPTTPGPTAARAR